MKKSLLLGFALIMLILTGCATLEVTTKFIDPQYKPEQIRTANILIGIQENVESNDFQKPFYELFESDQVYSHLYSDSLKTKLMKKFPQAYVIPSNNDSLGVILKFKSIPQIQNYCAPYIKNGLPTYLVQINKTYLKKESSYTEGKFTQGTTSYSPSTGFKSTPGTYTGGSTKTNCVVKYEVEVIELNEGKVVHSFDITDKSGVFMFAYKSAISFTLSKTLNGLVNSIDQLILKPESSDNLDVKW